MFLGIDVIFPESVSWGTRGAPFAPVDILRTKSGKETRVGQLPEVVHRYDAKKGIQSPEEWAAVWDLFVVAFGPTHTFMYKDWLNFKSTVAMGTGAVISQSDQPMQNTVTLGILGDGATKIFQIQKRHIVGSQARDDTISKPKTGTLLVEVNSVLQTETTNYTVDYATGLVTFVVAPPNSETVRAGFEFFREVRFDIEWPSISYDDFENGNFRSMPMIELK